MLAKADYERALMSQSACNASGLVHSLAEVMSKLCKEGLSTDDRNQHPIVVLYVTQLAYLSGANERYADAWKAVQEVLA